MNLSIEKLTGFAPSRRWNAHWIWPNVPNPKQQNVYALFRRTVDLGEIAGTRIFISADTCYQLFVNGQHVARGQPLSMPFFQYYNEHDLGAFLKPGPNCIGVIVHHLGTIPFTRGGLLAEMVDRQGKPLLATDASWRGTICPAWRANTFYFRMNVSTPFQEHFDARQFPADFAAVAFDDSAWLGAQVVPGWSEPQPPAVRPWTRLVPRDIQYLSDTPVLPQKVEQAGDALALNNRVRSEDLSTTLSQPILPLRHALLENPENLLRGSAPTSAPTIARCSVEHLSDPAFDGVYDPCILLDFGKVITAYLELDLEGAAGSGIDIGYAERLVDGHFNNAIEGQFADRYTLRDGRQRFIPFHWRAFRYVKLRIRQTFEPLKIHGVRALIETYPYEERGGFHSGDETLNRIFEISRYTVRLCSHEALMDTPWREAAQWLGDVAAVTLPAIYACFGDTALPGKFLRQAAMNQYPTGLISNVSNAVKGEWDGAIPDYSLWWIIGLWGHYLYTGETRWIDNFYPQVLRVLQAHLPYLNERGLIEDMPFWVFIDWADVDKRGECAAYNALFYGALECAQQMARLRGDTATLGLADEIRSVLKANFTARLFDPARALLADARLGERFSDKTSEQANMAAIRFGLVDEKLGGEIAARLFERQRPSKVTEAQPFFMVVVLQALQLLGRMDLALNLLRDRWGTRMVAHGASSTYEEWTINGSRRSGEFEPFLRSLSHAWSACPAEFLIRNLIGLEILSPGCASIRLSPTRTDFDYDVTFPTPRGPVRVTHKQGKVEVNVPAEVKVVA